jgi:lysine-N-methylase
MAKRVPLEILDLPEQRYTCHGCGDCCRDFSVQLRDEDLERLEAQGWAKERGESVTVEFRGRRYLRQRPDGGCLFLQDDGLCEIHARYGFHEKPVACRLFPFNLAPDSGGTRAGLNFACQSVRANRGSTLESHRDDLRRALREVPESVVVAPPLLAGDLRAEPAEVDALTAGLDRWLGRDEVPLTIRLDGFAWLAQGIGAASFSEVRGERITELIDLLVSALPDELLHLPVDPPGRGQRKQLRQAVFARIEDPRFTDDESRPTLGAKLDQWRRSRRFARGRGSIPGLARGWSIPEDFESVAAMPKVPGSEAVTDLVVRWLRSTVRGGRAWGSGYYGWSIADGVQALALNLACVGWLARAHAAGVGEEVVTLDSVGEALGRIDRASGRAVWLGSMGERLRLRYLATDDGLRRLVRSNW